MTVSHELRTPLTAIYGWSRLLATGQLREEHKAPALATIERNARAQTRLIDDLLDVSRVITGKLRLDIRQVNLEDVVRGAVEAMRPALAAKGIRLETAIDPNEAADRRRSGAAAASRVEPPVECDEVHASRRARGAASPAIGIAAGTGRHGHRRGNCDRVPAIRLRAVSPAGGWVAATVRRPRTRPGDRASPRRAPRRFRVSRERRGRPWRDVQGHSPGAGAQARRGVSGAPGWRHPCQVGCTSRRHPRAGRGRRTRGARALRIHPRNRRRPRHDGVVGLSRPAISPQDVLVSDIEMPDEDGYELVGKALALAQDRGARLNTIAVTAYARTEDRLRALDHGYQWHLSKPVEPSELVSVVASLANSPPGAARLH